MNVRSGGGWRAIRYTLRKARQSGGLLKFWRAMRSPNACKTCGLGMGGADGGMTNELGKRFEVCKKSVQAMAADMQGKIPDGFFKRFSVSEMKGMTSRELEHAGRLTEPLLLEQGATHYREISWDEAIKRATLKLHETSPADSFFYFSGRSSNEAGFLLQLFARVYGTNNVNNCSYYCHQASGVALTDSFGSSTATIMLEDIAKSDAVFLFGANPASNHPRFMKELMDLRRRGGKVVVINPVKEVGLCNFRVPSDWRSLLFGSEIASEYIQPRIGGDIAMMVGIGKCLLEWDAISEEFISNHTNGWSDWRAELERSTWPEILAASGLKEVEIRTAAEIYRHSNATIFSWAMGMTHHRHGVDNVRCISNLALMRGMVGGPGCGLLPLRGHSNVQGMGTMAVVPKMKSAVIERLERELGTKMPTAVGMDTMACVRSAHANKVRLAWCLGGNLYGSNPSSSFANEAMSRIDQIVYFNTTLNTGHANGCGKETIILPVRARDEEEQVTTQESMFSLVRRSSGGPPRHAGTRTETSIVVAVAQELFGTSSPVDWSAMRDHDNIRDLIAKAIPGFEPITSGKEFHIAGRAFHTPSFATADGRANFAELSIPDNNGCAADELLLMSVRSEGQFNTVVYEEEDLYRNQSSRDVILMNEADIKRFGLCHQQRVTVSSAQSEMKNIEVRSFDISRGSALMYYPECNGLYSMDCDPKSLTPSFKNVAVKLVASAKRE